MKVKLENREYELKANGKFMLKYQQTFHENMITALYKAFNEKDALICCQLTYCAIDETRPFDEWMDSFETPLFILQEMNNILEYLIREVEPTVNPKQVEEEPKKKEMTDN